MQKILGQLSDIDLRLLKVFRVVADCGGISAAEVELNIGRSTISRHVKDLEIRLGVTLCQRGRAGFVLSPEGQHVYQSSLRLMGALDEFRADVQSLHKDMTGKLAIALFDKTVTNQQAKISEALQLFDQRAPKVSLDLYVETLSVIESGVIEGRYQLGIVPGQRQSSSLNYQYLFDEKMALYCGYHHPLFKRSDITISAQEIVAQKYAGLGHHSPNMDTSQRKGFSRQATAYDQEAIATLLLSGAYLAYLPEHYARSFVEQGLIRALGGEDFAYHCPFLAVTRHSPKPSRILACFIDCLNQAHGVQ
ncbi:LysR family transcriptional regulator [Agarivorans sp. Toyoura001]|uniref:LysR family transcriptional regulator n=1 Tax=unclassified Agarivorans TaxID=2636026 RepID=UPI0010EFA747|nr:LysR family transcriptional regulator [Agarivorans sp. Toyoura001]GDY25443.1 LysR family transcriptional regulator [Agarivorans sp. Toyoura001]